MHLKIVPRGVIAVCSEMVGGKPLEKLLAGGNAVNKSNNGARTTLISEENVELAFWHHSSLNL